jgi:tRNA threonylcarbamoyl adenosine modification protein (Sua5/YciO/YrdC/YwlC family)
MEAAATVAACLLAGELVVIPTDTVYGLAAHPERADAVARLYVAKTREQGKPIPLLAESVAAARVGLRWCAAAEALADRFWPGALTLVLPVTKTDGETEGVRMPDCALALAVLRAAGGRLRVTSANRSGRAPALTAVEACAELGSAARMVLDGGKAPGGTASSVVRVVDDVAEVLRVGSLGIEELRAAAPRAHWRVNG